MKRVLQFFFLASLIITSCSRADKNPKVETTAGTSSRNDLPAMQLTKLDGEKLDAKSLHGHSIVLILFQPDCDHCQREAQQIKKNISSFADYQLYFVSADALNAVTKFALDYNLSAEPNVSFVLTDVQSILDNFGPIPAPSLYIYSATGKLVQKFNGETDINKILEVL